MLLVFNGNRTFVYLDILFLAGFHNSRSAALGQLHREAVAAYSANAKFNNGHIFSVHHSSSLASVSFLSPPLSVAIGVSALTSFSLTSIEK